MALQESRLEIREFGEMNFEPKAKKLKPGISDDGTLFFYDSSFFSLQPRKTNLTISKIKSDLILI